MVGTSTCAQTTPEALVRASGAAFADQQDLTLCCCWFTRPINGEPARAYKWRGSQEGALAVVTTRLTKLFAQMVGSRRRAALTGCHRLQRQVMMPRVHRHTYVDRANDVY